MSNRSIDAIVSPDWLGAHLGDEGLVVIDVRAAEAYAEGHIPGAVSVPFAIVSAWADCTEELLLELPPEAELLKVMGDCGLTARSTVVVIGRFEEAPAPPYALADAARVAATLISAGVGDVAVLNGGFPRWLREGRPVTSEVPDIIPVVYSGAIDRDLWVSTEYVEKSIGRSVLVDARDPDQYFGASIDPFAEMRGHIPTARNLPMIWVWEPDGAYRPFDFIKGMAEGTIGADKDQEIITYCGVGGYAATWWFLLTQLLGYKNVRIYDGSMEAWVKAHELVRYTWTE
jgi:thiosulfate/3-mercaptopyruvate sulfurtransferase